MKNNIDYNHEPLISIVIPVYNSSKYLEKCLESIFCQTYKKIEIIAVDDGSTDESLKILKNMEQKDPRMTVVSQKNSGGIYARMNGIKKANGEYILVEDSDDWLENNLVEKCVDVIKEDKDVDIIKFGYIFEPSKKKKNLLVDGIIKNEILKNSEINQVIARLLYCSDCNHIWNEMVRKKLYDFDDDIFKHIVHKGEDLQINLQIWQMAKKAVFLRDYLYHYIDNPNGITNRLSRKKIINDVKDNIYLNGIRKEIALRKFGYVNSDALINKTMSLLSSKIIRVLAFSESPRDDLIFIQNELEKDLKNFLGDSKTPKLEQNFLQTRISNNVMNGCILKNMKYRTICRMLMKLKGKA